MSLILQNWAPKNVEPKPLVTESTIPELPAIYHFSGDYNITLLSVRNRIRWLHFIQILHGLATYGHVAKMALEELGGNDPSALGYDDFDEMLVPFLLVVSWQGAHMELTGSSVKLEKSIWKPGWIRWDEGSKHQDLLSNVIQI